MNSSEWLGSADPLAMLYAACGSVSERKLRFFACACFRRTQLCLHDQPHRDAVRFAERLADTPLPVSDATSDEGNETAEDDGLLLDAPKPPDYLGAEEEDLPQGVCVLRWQSYVAAREAVIEAIEDAAAKVSFMSGRWHSTREEEAALLATMLRDVVGVPNLILALDTSWLEWQDCTVVRLAQAAYDERELPSGHLDVKRLTILADALEEAGCTNEDILGHLRGPGPHLRGCWVVDLLLGKE